MIMKNKSKIEDEFTGVIVKTKDGCDFEKGLCSKTWNKKAFKLCTEPITLKNE